jgi:cytochrome c oxidase assembly protein subunit 15
VTANWVALVLIYLVVIAGSFVRITGSGMGCPDWPKCFGSWIPPSEVEELPENYQKIYAEGRAKKVAKFSKFLNSLGLEQTASELEKDPNLLKEQPFNASKTWTEWVNRLFGFLAGNMMLVCFLWMLARFRKRRIILIAGINLILMAVQAWFGSIVVASNLVPWTITIHMFLALVIIGLQLYIIHKISPTQSKLLPNRKWPTVAIWFSLVIIFYQMFLGTQVRESIDSLITAGVPRTQWIDQSGMGFFIHRSFSWVVLILLGFVAYKNQMLHRYKSIQWVFALLLLEIFSGILLAYADVPGLVQTSHLLIASVIFGILVMTVFRTKIQKS